MKPVSAQQEESQRLVYEAPAIIYEGQLTTRAGSQPPPGGPDFDVDPAKLFGNVK